MGRGLLLWGGGATAPARIRAQGGALVVAWPGCDHAPLSAAGVPCSLVEDVLGAEALAAVDAAPARWARVWARLPLAEARSFRELACWRGESLLWAAEAFLRDATAGPRCAGTVELCLRLLEALRPDELDACGLAPADTALVARSATAAGVLFHGEPGRPRALAVIPRVRTRGLRTRLFGGRPARLSPAAGGATGLALALLSDPAAGSRLSTLFATLRREAALDPAIVSLAELVRLENAHVRREARATQRELQTLYASLRGTPALLATYVHRGVGFADLAAADLEVLLCTQLPALARLMACARESLESARPAALVLCVDDPDERRALGTVARLLGRPWLVVTAADARRHGLPERADFGPQPVATVDASDPDPTPAVARLLSAMRGSVGAR